MNTTVPPEATTRKQLPSWSGSTEIAASLTQPDEIYWCDGSAEEYDRLWCRVLVEAGTFWKRLSDAKRPSSYLARVGPRRRRSGRGSDLHLLSRTSSSKPAPSNNWRDPTEMRGGPQ